ncbi:hypothetical protein FF38_00205 [Lucilia cuprina]|uniref:Uncharacterized protein n=1 Tax=Lucilia cuprina TaxID=7375 RepID=A0A0L0BR75_LUCCU|nr:hypothetical protein FF38_00205 [Lucilia cuprina]
MTVKILYKNEPVCAPTNKISSSEKLLNASYCKCLICIMPTNVAIVAVPYINNSHIVTSITARATKSGLDIKTKNNIKDIIVKTNTKIPTNKPLWARAQSTEGDNKEGLLAEGTVDGIRLLCMELLSVSDSSILSEALVERVLADNFDVEPCTVYEYKFTETVMNATGICHMSEGCNEQVTRLSVDCNLYNQLHIQKHCLSDLGDLHKN